MSEKKPKISIITVCYNEEKEIASTCKSIVSQTYSDYEWIVIDGGSSDRTLEILKEYEQSISILISEKDNGVYDAMNKGIRRACGEYLLFLNGGDYLLGNDALKKVFEIAKYDGDVLYGDVEFAYGDGHHEISNFSDKITKNYFIKEGIGHQAAFIKKILFDKYGYYDSTFKIVGDWEKWIVFNKNQVSFKKIPHIISVQKRFDGLSTAKNEKIWKLHQKEHKFVLDKYFPLYGLWAEFRKNMHLIIGFSPLIRIIARLRKAMYRIISKINTNIHAIFFYFALESLTGTNRKKRNPRLIISITSFPERMNVIYKCLFSLLSQNVKPDELILWLGEEEFPNREGDIPEEVISLCRHGLTIRFCKDIKSYKKLIPALKEYPNDIIITADDDIFYPKKWLKMLYDSYKKKPQYIHCQRANRIKFEDDDKTLKPYLNWPNISNPGDMEPSFKSFLNGCGGVLYPPNCLYRDVAKEDLFMSLCPRGDDIWFWAMAVLKGTRINVVKNNIFEVNDLLPDKSLGNHLWNTNGVGGNDIQLKNILRYYPIVLDKIKSEVTH